MAVKDKAVTKSSKTEWIVEFKCKDPQYNSCKIPHRSALFILSGVPPDVFLSFSLICLIINFQSRGKT